MWETMAGRVEAMGGEVRTSCQVSGIDIADGRARAVHTSDESFEASEVISSLPLQAVVLAASPAPNPAVLEAAAGLRYRDFLTVALVVDCADPFPDNWIYVHDPGVAVGRIQNYRSWSPAMVPDESKSCLGLEYFCFAGDDLWNASDDDLVARASAELERLRLVPRGAVERGYVVRVPKAYPIYDADYAARIRTIREWLDGIPNLQQVGRNGLHRYNNSDHSCLTALRAADNVMSAAGHDVWSVNAESVYHEERVAEEHPYRPAPSTVALQES
jgi:protoporphyrinogen oxidase